MKKLAELLIKLNILDDVPSRLAALAAEPGEYQADAQKALAIYNSMFEPGGIEDEYFLCTSVEYMEQNGLFQ